MAEKCKICLSNIHNLFVKTTFFITIKHPQKCLGAFKNSKKVKGAYIYYALVREALGQTRVARPG
jgi:hypothetical protein